MWYGFKQYTEYRPDSAVVALSKAYSASKNETFEVVVGLINLLVFSVVAKTKRIILIFAIIDNNFEGNTDESYE